MRINSYASNFSCREMPKGVLGDSRTPPMRRGGGMGKSAQLGGTKKDKKDKKKRHSR